MLDLVRNPKDTFSYDAAHIYTISVLLNQTTVKFLNFGTLENIAEIILKLEKKRFNHRVMHPKDADSTANGEDPDQTAPLGAV